MAQTLDNLDININVDVRGLPEITTAQRRISSLGNQVNRTTAAVRKNASAYNANAVATNKWAKGALQQAGFQIGDFAVQLTNGTNGLQAFGQQGSQLAGVFGPLGAVIGAGIAIASAVGVAYQKASGEARSLTEALDDLGKSTSLYREAADLAFMSSDELADKYGEAAQSARELFEAQEGLRRLDAIDSLSRSVITLRDEFGEFGKVSREELEAAQQAYAELGEDINRPDNLNDTQLAGALNAIEIYNETVRDLQSVLGATEDDAFNLAKELTDLASAEGPDAIAKELDDIRSTFNSIVGGIDNATEEQRELLGQLIESSIAALNLNAEIDQTEEGTREVAKNSSDIADELQRAADAVMNINTNAFNKLQQLQGELRSRARGLTDEQIRIQNAAIRAEQAARQSGVDSAAELSQIAAEAAQAERGIIEAEKALEQFGSNGSSSIRKVQRELSDAEKRNRSLVTFMENGFEEAFMGIVKGTSSAKDAFRSFARETIAELYRVFVVQQLVGMISGAVGGFFNLNQVSGPSMPLGTGNRVPTMNPSYAGGGYTGMGSRSGGVDGRGGFPAILHPNETVIDHSRGQGMGTVIVNQTINVSTGVQQTVRTEIKQLMPQIAESAKQAVVDAKRRGGSYGRAFA